MYNWLQLVGYICLRCFEAARHAR